MPFVDIRGTRLHYQTHGRETPPSVLFIHGLGSCCEDWPFQLPVLGEKYRVITGDLRGHGKSDKPKCKYSLEMFAADFAHLLRELDEPPVHVVGLSLGGCTALQLALDHPERVRSLTLVNTFARLQPAGWRGVLRFAVRMSVLTFASMDLMAGMVSRSMFPNPEQKPLYEAAAARIAGNDKTPYRRAIRAILRFDARKRCAAIRAPSLVVAGDRDATVPLSPKLFLRDNIPGAEFVMIPNSGHATPIDQPQKFNDVLMDFVERH